MISFTGFDDVIKRVYDNSQGHVFEYWDELDENQRKELLEQLADVDFELLKKNYESAATEIDMDYGAAPYIAIPESDDDKRKYEEAKEAGIDYIKNGSVAAFVVAGGQGSRLGYDGPKGKYPVGPISNKTLFQIHGEKIKKYSIKYGVTIPWLIMTSRLNHEETVEYLSGNNFFGIDKDDVKIFPQNMIPSLDGEGKLVLESMFTIFKNPDGHGGSLTALKTSGCLDWLKSRGIETISYFQVDNPLVKIIDPVFIGFHIERGALVSSKAVKKTIPAEKVGVFVRYSDKSFGMVEYSDLPKEKMDMRDDKGGLVYSLGNPAIHIFQRNFVEKITASHEVSLPFHRARKKINAFKNGKTVEIEGLKFEKFVFDALPMTDKNLIFETLRREEFAPVKNASGVDSVESAREMMMDLFNGWLDKRGIKVLHDLKRIEISPLVAVDYDDIDESIEIPDIEDVYLK
ncbi:UTP--glucose-1-phosphate uridylyltransferase [Spirochaetota bacterium]